MFYCSPCAKANQWPSSFGGSIGPCEICGKVAACYNVPSSRLPRTLTEVAGATPEAFAAHLKECPPDVSPDQWEPNA